MPHAIKALRTPDPRFSKIPDFNYPISYSEELPGYQGLRGAWVDAGHIPSRLAGVTLWQY